MTAILEARGLGKRYGRRWALRDCTLSIPPGRVVGLVGPNGAGKTTLLHLAVGLLSPTAGSIEVLGTSPAAGPAQLARIGFVAQDMPLYARLSIADHLRMGGWLNPGWDQALAAQRIEKLGLDPGQRAGKLSGGQRAQLALTLAGAKRPELLLLDEPVASLDPLARHEFLTGLRELVAGQQLSVVLSSHLIADLQAVCDYLIILVASRVHVSGPVAELLAGHHRVTGAGLTASDLPAGYEVIQSAAAGPDTTLVVRSSEPVPGPAWTASQLSLEELVLAYMGRAAQQGDARPPAVGVPG